MKPLNPIFLAIFDTIKQNWKLVLIAVAVIIIVFAGAKYCSRRATEKEIKTELKKEKLKETETEIIVKGDSLAVVSGGIKTEIKTLKKKKITSKILPEVGKYKPYQAMEYFSRLDSNAKIRGW